MNESEAIEKMLECEKCSDSDFGTMYDIDKRSWYVVEYGNTFTTEQFKGGVRKSRDIVRIVK